VESTLQTEIHSILAEINSLEKVQRHLEDIHGQIIASNSELSKLDKKIDEELKDIESLEKIGLKSLFTKVLGSKEEQLEIERQEYLQATLKYNELKKTTDLLIYEKELLEKKARSVVTLKKNLERLKKKREVEIKRSNGPAAQSLFDIADKLERNFILNKELVEAIDAGEKAKASVLRVLNELKNAKQWGQWDMASRGRGANYHKRHAIDRANQHVYKTQQLLRVYEKELRDLGMEVSLRFKLQNFHSFLDFFFDNLISDWIVQQKINHTVNNVLKTRDEIASINASLTREKEKTDQSTIALHDKRDSILES